VELQVAAGEQLFTPFVQLLMAAKEEWLQDTSVYKGK